jgi:hypothetical protein
MLLLPAVPLPAFAQDAAPADTAAGTMPPLITAEQALENAQAIYTTRTHRYDPCPQQKAGEIVICRQLEDPAKLRVSSPTDDAIAAGKSASDGVPRAPYVLGLPSCDEVKCHRMGHAAPPPLLIDLKAIPEPPAGSEAAEYGFESGETAEPASAPPAP